MGSDDATSSADAVPAASAQRHATSLDGRAFSSPLTSPAGFVAGEFVEISDADGTTSVGQVERLDGDSGGGWRALGRLYGVLDSGGGLNPRASHTFAEAAVTSAGPDALQAMARADRAQLDVGAMTTAPSMAAKLLPHRFNRHTFWCGQSGSGKTYALGVLLEELLLHTKLPMVIFDPNADFVRLREVRDDADPERAERLRQADIRVLRPDGLGGEPLRARFRSMSLRARAAVVRLDPLVDRAEYNTLLHAEESVGLSELDGLLDRLKASSDPGAQLLGLRLENLGVLDWQIWALQQQAATEIIDTRPDATVLDIGNFKNSEESLVIALAVLDELWRRRDERRPVLLVIDEAHNLCSPDADGPLQTAILERIIQIAAEGRKFGLWLLLSTQRPSKVHPGIISQCDNLTLMRMSSQQDLDELATIFGFAPPALLARSPHFRQGEALMAGGFVSAPTLVTMRNRLTNEGGVDVKVPMRTD